MGKMTKESVAAAFDKMLGGRGPTKAEIVAARKDWREDAEAFMDRVNRTDEGAGALLDFVMGAWADGYRAGSKK